MLAEMSRHLHRAHGVERAADGALAAAEAGDGLRVVQRQAEVMVGRAQLARPVVEEVDAARLEVQGVERGPQRLRKGALEVFRVGEGGGDRRECGEAHAGGS